MASFRLTLSLHTDLKVFSEMFLLHLSCCISRLAKRLEGLSKGRVAARDKAWVMSCPKTLGEHPWQDPAWTDDIRICQALRCHPSLTVTSVHVWRNQDNVSRGSIPSSSGMRSIVQYCAVPSTHSEYRVRGLASSEGPST